MTDSVKPSAGLRAARIADTEERIVAAATELFVRNGYAATTLTAVADAAAVAHRTVYLRFGTKAALLKRVIDVAIVGDTKLIDLQSRDWYQVVLTAPTFKERIDAWARGSAQLMARAGDLFGVAQQAENTEPIIRDAGLAGRSATRDSTRRIITGMRKDGLISADIDIDWAAQTLAVLALPEIYLLHRELHGWGADDYERWLRTTWHATLDG